jgi:hypothetical protein
MAENLIVSTGAAGQVGVELDTFQGSAWNAIAEARDALDLMASLRPTFPEGTAKPGTAVGSIKYNNSLDTPKWDFTFRPPTWNIADPVLSEVRKYEVEDFTGDAPVSVSPNIPKLPTPDSVVAPGAVPEVSDVIIPDAPVLSVIKDPKEWIIALPTVPIINIDKFTGQRPSAAGIATPGNNFTWSEDPYTSETLTQIVDRVGKYFEGGVGIPPQIWESIWARDNDRENRAGEKQITEINEEWSGRNFQLPQGVQVARVDEVRQNIQSDANSRSRDIAIQEAQLEIENLKFAVQQGIALENLRGSWYQATQTRMLEAASFSAELAISLFNAEIGFYNSQVQMYLADVQVYQAEIEAELSRLEVYKSELEGQKIIGDLNLQQVQIYTAKVEALNVEIDRYNAVLAGIKTTVEVDAIRIDAYQSEVQAYSERIKAISLEYNAYETAMSGAKIESDIHKSNVDAYSSLVQAYSSQIDASAKNSNIDIDINKYKLDEYNSKIQGFISELEAEVKNLQAQSTGFDAEVKAYVSKIESEKVNIQAQSSQYLADIQLANQTTSVNIANSDTNAKNALALAGIIQQGLDAIAKINGAYAGSALAAANISMSISDSASNSASI